MDSQERAGGKKYDLWKWGPESEMAAEGRLAKLKEISLSLHEESES